MQVIIVCLFRFEYESTDTSREEMKRKFAPTMEFVEEYLKDVVSQPFPFGDKEKNELTLEVKYTKYGAFFFMFSQTRLGVSVLIYFPMFFLSLVESDFFFLLQVVNLARNLVYFGFYSFSELLRLTRTLLAILDIVQHPLTYMNKLNKSPEAGQCRSELQRSIKETDI